MIVCVYAVIGRLPGRLALQGVAGERLRVVAAGSLAAVVGELRRRPSATPRSLRRYAVVIESIASRTPAVLPARFGTVAADDEEVAFLLRSRAAGLRPRLRAVRGRAQMTIRLVLASDSGDGATQGVESSHHRGLTPSPRATQGTQYLRQRAAEAREIPGFEPIRDAVRSFVKDERMEKRPGIVTVNHLIPRAAADRYRSAVIRAAGHNGVRLMVTGPLAPYAFADNW